ncbi:Protein ERGIC-53 [Papilio machaon]|uniref:Protein ERGIC-53 n=1 Tax=Papilio machaon TaxID=76193 RepID=A0A194RMY0_PAPMA|nr:Protein ERGIC-53 [Papilio machaon]
MSSIKLSLLILTVLSVIFSINTQTVHKRFEYKYSFKPPYLAQKDGTVPFWEYGGNAIASGESVRLAPSLRSQKGAIWTKQPINFDWWEVDVMFKVTGRGRIGADGLAFWYTTQRGDYNGDVFGSSDRWNGLAIMFDSFDNDNKHNNPYIMAVVNDGTKNFDHKSDGSTQLLSGCLRDFRNKPFPTRARIEYYLNTLTAFWYTTQRGDYNGDVFGSSDRWNGLAIMFDSFDNDNKHNNPYIMAVVNDGTKNFDHKSDGSTQLLSGCLRDFRNKPFPTRARIEYYLNTLTVYFHNGMTNNELDYELCFRAENVALPRGGYFGLSAATGGLADDHDVIHLLTTSLHSTQQQGGQQISNDEQQKLSQEYQEYQKKLEQQKTDYRKEHPDEVRDKDGEFDDWFESDGQRELRQIFQGQGQIHDILRDLNKKVDEVIGKQMNSLSMLTAVYSQSQGQPIQPGQAPMQMPSLPIGRQDWDALVANNQLMINTIAELKGFIIDVSRKSDSLLAMGGAGAGAGGAAGGAAINPQFLNEMRDNVNQVKQAVNGVAQRLTQAPQMAAQSACPEVSCVGTTTLLLVVAAQLTLMFLYTLYKERKEAQAKKFF